MIKALISIRIKSFLGSLGSKKKRGSYKSQGLGLLGKSLIIVLLLSIFLLYFFIMAFEMASIFVPLGLDSLYFGLFLTLSLSLIFLLSIFETKSELFECKDNELLLSMPIKPSHIVISRVFSVLVYNYVEQAIIVIPCVVAYLAVGGDARGVFGALLISLFIPLLATALSSGVGYIVAIITKRVKNNSFLTVLVSLVFIALYFFGYSYFMSGMESLETPGMDASAISERLGVLGYIGSAALFDPFWTTLIIALSVVTALVAYLVISHSYISIVTNNKGAKRNEYKAKRLERGGAFSALVKKELKRFFSSAAYILNAGLGLVFLVAAAVFLLIKSAGVASLASSLGLSDSAGIISSLVISALCAVLSMNCISAVPLSLEGGSLWIIKTMPLSARTVLFAKAMPHVIVALPPSLISSVIAMIAVKAPPAYFAFFILTPIAFNFLGAFVGVFFNTLLPKFQYENEVQVIKQSASTLVTMLVMIFLGLVTVGINLALSIFVSPLFASGLTLFLLILLAGLFAALVAGPSARRYEAFCA